jgi:hypothetical protein
MVDPHKEGALAAAGATHVMWKATKKHMKRRPKQTAAWQRKRTPAVYAELPPPPPEFVVVKASSKPKE